MKRLLLALALLLLAGALLLSACAAPEAATTTPEITTQAEDFDYHYNLGLKYLSEGNYQEAILAFTAAIDIDAKRPEGYLGAAQAYIALGDLDGARDILEQGAQALPDDADIAALLAELEGQAAGQPDEGAKQSAFYAALSDTDRQLLSTLEQALRGHDASAALGIQTSPEFAMLLAVIAQQADDERMRYSPDADTVVYVWGDAEENHMDLYIGQGATGHRVGSRYGGNHGNYVMSIADFTAGVASGPFSYEIDNLDGRGMLHMTGVLVDGKCHGYDVQFEEPGGDVHAGNWDGYYTISGWHGY